MRRGLKGGIGEVFKESVLSAQLHEAVKGWGKAWEVLCFARPAEAT